MTGPKSHAVVDWQGISMLRLHYSVPYHADSRFLSRQRRCPACACSFALLKASTLCGYVHAAHAHAACSCNIVAAPLHVIMLIGTTCIQLMLWIIAEFLHHVCHVLSGQAGKMTIHCCVQEANAEAAQNVLLIYRSMVHLWLNVLSGYECQVRPRCWQTQVIIQLLLVCLLQSTRIAHSATSSLTICKSHAGSQWRLHARISNNHTGGTILSSGLYDLVANMCRLISSYMMLSACINGWFACARCTVHNAR